jgi:translocation and assembly module TamA
MDHIDNNLNPHKGMLTLISLKGMFPTQSRYADSYFFKLLVEHTWFIPLQKVVAAFRVRFGHIFHRCFSNILPSERFYLGGSHSVRSYEADLAPPLGCFIDKHGKKNLVPRGGKTMLNVNIELRLPEFKKIGIVLFSDMGILSGDDFIEFEGKNMVGGTGFGIRFFTPIGPLRFDVAWKWKTEMSHERRFNWYLTFGQAF